MEMTNEKDWKGALVLLSKGHEKDSERDAVGSAVRGRGRAKFDS